MHGYNQPTRTAAPSNWLEQQLVRALFELRPLNYCASDGLHQRAIFARADACRLICVAAESPETKDIGFPVATLTTDPADPDAPDWQPETISTVDDETCILANAGLLTRTIEPSGIAWRIGSNASHGHVPSALADADLRNHEAAGWAGGLVDVAEIRALGSAYFSAFKDANCAILNIEQAEFHGQPMFPISRERHPILCDILDRCGYAGRYNDALSAAA